MANNIIRRVWNQNRMVNIEDLTGVAFQAESGGHTFEISGIDETGAAVALSGTVSGVFRRPDNADIALTGSASDGVVSVTLSEDCYAVPGRFGLTVFVTSNSQKVAVYACVGTVAVSSTGNVAGDTPASVEDLIDDINAAIADLNSAIGQIPASYANVMAAIAPTYSGSALYSVGSYAWYNGSLYRCTTPITTAEAWTAAHWTAAALGDDVGDLKSEISDLADGYVPFDTTWEIGGISGTTGADSTNTKRLRSAFIDASNEKIAIKSLNNYQFNVYYYSTNSASGYLRNDGFGTAEKTIDHHAGYIRIVANTVIDIDSTNNIYVSVIKQSQESKNIASIEDSVGFISEAIGATEGQVTIPATLETGKYVKNNGSVATASAFAIYGLITLKRSETIKCLVKGYNTNIAVISSYANGVYTPLVVCDDSDEKWYSYKANRDLAIVLSSATSTAVKYQISSVTIVGEIDDLKQYDVVCFASMAGIGDSLMSGASQYVTDYHTGLSDRKEYSWGKYIEREHGIPFALYSQGGTTTRSWLTRETCIGAFNADTAKDCYIIGLGVNDAYSLGMDYLGTSSDVHVGSEDQNADTYYGNYSRIIAKIQEKSPHAKIFCLTNPILQDSELGYNTAVETMATLYDNVHIIDLYDDDFFETTDFTDYWKGAHSTAIGYKVMSQHIYNLLNTYIYNNYTDFLDVQWINAD